ncbi:MAG TPA: hypothetical protein VML55_12110 [Planctomycetaceae bacterium]|nr:hypothetical protein [Planctomycetaceae bacterium]
MRTVLVIVALVLILGLIGWITFGTGDRPSMRLETDRVRHDTHEAVERGKDAIDGARGSLREELRDEEREEVPRKRQEFAPDDRP